jgi:hypothetical protein
MNRDWLPVQLPESQARIKTFRKWMPNVLCMKWEQIHLLFQPGEPHSNQSAYSELNQVLTIKLGYHIKLDKIGSSYFVEENYDDFGKGSSLPLTSMV